MKKIVILASNPQGTSRLRLDKEVSEIYEGLQRSQWRKHFDIESRWAVRPRDIHRALLDIRPQIVHFCGHGEGDAGLVLENNIGELQLVGTEALSGLFELFADSVECVILNACYSQKQADVITKHINYVIGMNQAVQDPVAIDFAVGFYDGLGSGLTIKQAFEIGLAAIQPNSSISTRKLIPEHSLENETDSEAQSHFMPILRTKAGLGEYTDPANYIGTVWTQIIPELSNANKRHLITIKWASLEGFSQWQQTRVIPEGGLLLCYQKRNKDVFPRTTIVSPLSEIYEDGVVAISNATKVINGHLEEPVTAFREEINSKWQEIKY
ncbi:MAG: CHAT domain-containing protein [Nostoc sp. ChiQUE01a]|nr:CHAT domain-containing protein [Nostoc sp. ChiQUE01a]